MECTSKSKHIRRSDSPVFFTGCTTTPPRSDISIRNTKIKNTNVVELESPIQSNNLTRPNEIINTGNVKRTTRTPLLRRVNERDIWNGDLDSRAVSSLYKNFTDHQSNVPRHNEYEAGHSQKRRASSPIRPTKNPRLSLSPNGPEDCWFQLDQSIWDFYHRNKQTPKVYQMKMKLRNQLHQMLLSTFPNCGLYVVGSSMSGFAANRSDMDMCLMLTQSEIDQEEEATNILKTVYNTFQQYEFLTNVELIPAKVPILRFKDSQSSIEVDLNINNSVGIRNTQLLTSYSRMDERVAPLVVLTKIWARCHDINDAKNHTLSSYSLVLMVIHYLQCGCSPPVLPCLQKLQPDKYQPFSDVRSLNLKEDLPPFVSGNIDNLAQLFLGFLEYFGNQFDFSNDVMSVRVGGLIPKVISMNNSASPKNKKGHWKHLCIEEPFNLTNTACSVFKDSVFYYIKDVFLRSWNILRSSKNLRSIISSPESNFSV